MSGDEFHDASNTPARAGMSPVRLWIAGIFLLALGAVGTYVMVALPIMHSVAGRSWVRAPCRVIDSTVRRHRGKIGPTYSVDIVYEYDVDGHSYRSDRWDFFPSIPGIGHDSAAAVARLHHPGRMMECYVNPRDPSQAVLDRRIRRGFPRILLPLALLAGGSAMVFSLVCTRRAVPATAAIPHDVMAERADSSAGWRGVLTALGLAVFLNGSAYVLGRILLDGWREGQRLIGLTILVVGSGVVGIVMVGVLIRQLLRCLPPPDQARR